MKIILGLLWALVSDTMGMYWYFPTSVEVMLGNTDVKQAIGVERTAECSLWIVFYVSTIRHTKLLIRIGSCHRKLVVVKPPLWLFLTLIARILNRTMKRKRWKHFKI